MLVMNMFIEMREETCMRNNAKYTICLIVYMIVGCVYFLNREWTKFNAQASHDVCEYQCSVTVEPHLFSKDVSIYVDENLKDLDALVSRTYQSVATADPLWFSRGMNVTIRIYNNKSYTLLETKRYE